MTGRKRVFWGIAVAALLVVSVTGAVVATVIERAGPMRFELREKCAGGDNVGLTIPAAALACCLPFVPEGLMCQMPEEAVRQIGAARVFCERIADQPDFVLCHMEKDGERVHVEKKGKALVVSIDSEDETAHISIPLWLLDRVVAKFDTCARDGGA